nr:hypothetical protein [Caldilineaceae bacterium]
AKLRQRHYAAYLHLFRTADSHLRGPEAASWWARLVPEQANFRAAIQWTLDEAHYVDAAWLIVASTWFWEQRGQQSDEVTRWLAQLLPHRHALAINLRLAIFIILHASSRDVPGEFQPLSRYTDEIMALLEVSSDKLLQSIAWYFMSVHYADFPQKAAILERSIALARLASDLPGPGPEFCLLSDRDFVLGTALYEYARRLVRRGEFVRAESLAKESVTLFLARGNRHERAGGLGTLGLLALLQGDLVQAHTHLHEAVTIAAAVNYRLMLGIWQPLLGIVTLYGGNITEARRLLTESLHLCLELENKYFVAQVCIYLAETALWAGELAQAEHWLVQNLAQDVDLQQSNIFTVEWLWVAARLATGQQQYQPAATLFGLADQMHGQVHYAIAGPMRALADAALAMVRAALDPAAFAAAFATGQQLSLEEAYATILAPSQVVGAPTKG